MTDTMTSHGHQNVTYNAFCLTSKGMGDMGKIIILLQALSNKQFIIKFVRLLTNSSDKIVMDHPHISNSAIALLVSDRTKPMN